MSRNILLKIIHHQSKRQKRIRDFELKRKSNNKSRCEEKRKEKEGDEERSGVNIKK